MYWCLHPPIQKKKPEPNVIKSGQDSNSSFLIQQWLAHDLIDGPNCTVSNKVCFVSIVVTEHLWFT